MAQQTELTVYALPGQVHTFVAKTEAVPTASEVSERFTLDGTDNSRLLLNGTNSSRLSLDGTNNSRITLVGTQ